MWLLLQLQEPENQVAGASDLATRRGGESRVTVQLEAAPSVQVEIDLYSGRPNPNWQLPAEAAADLMARIAALPAAAPWTAPDQLGYRGISVKNGGPTDRLFHRIDVYRGLVKIELVDKSIKWHRDQHRTIEKWFLQGAPPSELPTEQANFIAETIKVDP